MAGGVRAVVRLQRVRSARGGLAWPRALRLALRQDMGLHDGLELVEGEESADDVHVRALLAAGPMRFVDGGGAVGNGHGQRMCPNCACIGLIVGLDRDRWY